MADNMSDCGLEAVRAVGDGFANVILATARGPGPARNAGVAAARGTILAFTDSDCRPAPTWLEEGVEALKRFDIVGGAMKVTVASSDPSDVECFEKVFAFNNQRYVEKLGYSVTANLLTKKSVFTEVGGFVPTTIAEDVEWCQRATKAGFKLGYAPKALVSHPARENWLQLMQKWKRITLQSYFENQKNGGGKSRWLLRNVIILLSPFGHAFTVLRADELKTASQRLAAIRVLVRLRTWRFLEGMRILNGTVEDPWIRNK